MFEIDLQYSFRASETERILAERGLDCAETVAIDLGEELQESTPVAFGEAQQGWDVDSSGSGLNWSVTVSNAVEYIYYAIAGRGPGTPPPAGPGSNLERWTRLKGLARGAAYGIARNIGRFGTERWRSRQNALDIDPVTQQLRSGSPVRRAQERLKRLFGL